MKIFQLGSFRHGPEIFSSTPEVSCVTPTWAIFPHFGSAEKRSLGDDPAESVHILRDFGGGGSPDRTGLCRSFPC
jgi:hypothetical protein